MRLLIDVCILAVAAFVVEGFAPVRNSGRVERAKTAARFVAMSPRDNWTDDEDDEFDYDIEPVTTGELAGPASPGVAISCALAVAAAAMAWLSNDLHIIVGTGATVLATGGAVAALTAARSGSPDIALLESAESSTLDESSATGSFASYTNTQDTMASSANDQQSPSANLAREWQRNQAAERISMEAKFAPLEIADSGPSNDDVYDAGYDDAFTGSLTPATASALYSSSASAQLDSAPVPLATKIERLKVELELAREWQETNMEIKPAPPLHNGYQPVADPLNDLKPPSMAADDEPPTFPDFPIISSPTFPSGKGAHGSSQEIASKLKVELDLARKFFDDA